MANRQIRSDELDDNTVQTALMKADGNIKKAAALLGCSKSFLYGKIDDNERIRDTLANIRDMAADEKITKAEEVVDYHLKSKDLKAAIFILRSLGKYRGYLENEVAKSVSNKIVINIKPAVASSGTHQKITVEVGEENTEDKKENKLIEPCIDVESF